MGTIRHAQALLEAYDVVQIINLPTRHDRRREMNGELRRVGLSANPRITFFPAVAPSESAPWKSRGERGCYLSHLAILRQARDAGQSVLILEDDCDFTDAAFDSDWGKSSFIFYGGYGANDFSKLETNNIQGSHCMGFKALLLPELVEFLEDLAREPAPPPIDGAYVLFRRGHPEFSATFALPQVAVQRQSPSDIAIGRFDRNPLLAFLARIARKLNRRRYRRMKMMEGIDAAR